MVRETDPRESAGSEEKSDSGNHGEHPQPLSPLNPDESHDDRVENVLGTLTKLQSNLRRGEGARSVEFGNNGLGAIVEFECRRIEPGETEIPFVIGSVRLERPVEPQWSTTGLLHDLADVLGLEVVLEERIVEELPLDLGYLDLPPSLRLQLRLDLRSRTTRRGDRGGFRRDIFKNRSLLEEGWGGGLRDDRGITFGSGGLVGGWSVANDGGDALSGEPHLRRSGAIQDLPGV